MFQNETVSYLCQELRDFSFITSSVSTVICVQFIVRGGNLTLQIWQFISEIADTGREELGSYDLHYV